MLMVPSARGFVGAPGILYPWPYFVGATQPTTYASRSNLSIPVPATARANDFLLAIVNLQSIIGMTPPTGWTLLQQTSTFLVYYAFWDGHTTPSFSFGQIYSSMGCMFAYRNVDPTYIYENDPTYGAGVYTTEQQASTSTNISTSALYADGPNRTFFNAFFSLTSVPPSYLNAGVYTADSWNGVYQSLGYMPPFNQQAMLTRTDNASYYSTFGVADYFPCSQTGGYSGSNAYYGYYVTYGNGTPASGYSPNEDMFAMSMMLLPIGALPGAAPKGG